MHSKSIKKKIINIVAWVMLLTGIITISVISFTTYQQMDNQKINDLKKLSLERSNKINIFLKNSSNLAEHLVGFPNIIKWLENPDQENTKEALELFNNFNIKQEYLAVYILDKDGKAVISTDPSLVNNNYSFRPYFQKAMSGQANMDIAIGATSLAQGYYFAEPIRKEDGQVVGVFALKLYPESLYRILESETRDANAHTMLTDQYGVIIYSDDKTRILHSLGQLNPEVLNKIKIEKKFLNIDIKPIQYPAAQEILNQHQKDVVTYKFYDASDNENEVIAVAPITDYPLVLINEDNAWQLSIGAFNLAAISSLVISLSFLTILLALSILISKRLKPLVNLEEMAKEIGDGNLEIENKIKTGDELENLGLFFSKMAGKLHDYYGNLEKNVEERTKELNIKNEYLNQTKIATINILEDVENERNKTIELAKNLEKFKLALDSASDHVVITDPEGIVIYANAAMEKITGYSLAESIGKKAGTLWSYPMPTEYYQKMWKIIKTDKKTFNGEIKNKRKDGEIYDAKISIAPVLNADNEVEFFIGIERDITHEKMVDQAKTEFVSLASHQLRTPLSSINWYAEMLLSGDGGPLNEEQRGFVQEIYSGNHRMVELVNSLLNVSRLELGTFAVDPEPTNIIETAQSVLNELKPSIVTKKIKLNFEYDKEMPIIQADPKLIRIIFQNLLSNSIKYTPEKGSVSLKINKNKKNLLVEVADTGYGIPKKEQPRIFEKLFRAENVREKDTEGTGLGLYIVRSIVTHANGKISFKSVENKGTTFYLEIPLSGMKKKEGDKKIE